MKIFNNTKQIKRFEAADKTQAQEQYELDATYLEMCLKQAEIDEKYQGMMLKKLSFCFRWLLIGLTLSGLIDSEFLNMVAQLMK